MVFMILGLVLVVVAVADLLWTTIETTSAGGPVSSRVSRGLWRLVLWGAGPRRRGAHGLLRLGGFLVVLATFGTWLVGAWVGWTLVVSADPDAVVAAAGGAQASLVQRVAFVGTSLSTLGPGDYVAGSDLWRWVTALISMTGLGLATLAITWLVPVVAAVTGRRALAGHIHALGDSPQELITRHWDGRSLAPLAPHLRELLPGVARLAQQQLSYPVLHYFHDVDVRACGPVQVAVLDEALSLLACGLDRPAPGLPPGLVEALRRAIGQLLAVAAETYVTGGGEPPPPPGVGLLRRAGLPVRDPASFERCLVGFGRRRALLRAFVENDGWSWEAVSGTAPAATLQPGRTVG